MKVRCMICNKEYTVPCYEAIYHEHNLWELVGEDKSILKK